MFLSAYNGIVSAVSLVPGYLWWFFGHGGWLIFVCLLLWVLFQKYLEEIQSQYIKSMEWVFLNIRVPRTNELSTLAVEQAFAQMHAILTNPTFAQKYVEGQVQAWYSLEMVSLGGKISFIIRAPKKHKDLVESALYAQYPGAEITEVDDYLENLEFKPENSEIDLWGTELILVEDPGLPIKTYRDFEHPTAKDKIVDPLKPLFEAMAKMNPHEMFAVQTIILPIADSEWKPKGEKKAGELIEGPRPGNKEFNLLRFIVGIFKPEEHAPVKEGKNFSVLSDVEKERVNRVLNKVGKPGYLVKMRLLYLSSSEKFDKAKTALFIGAYKTFASANTNGFRPNIEVTPKLDYKLSESLEKPYIDFVVGKRKAGLFKNFKSRNPVGGSKLYVLNIEELSTIYHLPLVGEETVSSPNVDTVASKKSQPPANLPIGEY